MKALEQEAKFRKWDVFASKPVVPLRSKILALFLVVIFSIVFIVGLYYIILMVM
jgi:hypothetical protein